jgi:hypothetical protein
MTVAQRGSFGHQLTVRCSTNSANGSGQTIHRCRRSAEKVSQFFGSPVLPALLRYNAAGVEGQSEDHEGKAGHRSQQT